jgi:hypothetical protein
MLSLFADNAPFSGLLAEKARESREGRDNRKGAESTTRLSSRQRQKTANSVEKGALTIANDNRGA